MFILWKYNIFTYCYLFIFVYRILYIPAILLHNVTNPVHELTPTHHIVSCTTLQLHITHGLHFPSTIALVTQLSPITHFTHCLHPRTWTNHMHRCSSFTALLKQPSHSHTLRSLVWPRLTFWALVLFLCMTLDCLPPLILCCLALWYCSWKFWLCCCLPWLLPGIVYVSALPLIVLTLMVDHCLFDPV